MSGQPSNAASPLDSSDASLQARLQTVEAALTRVSSSLERVEALGATAADTLDAWMASNEQRPAQIQALLALGERASHEQTLSQLTSLLELLDGLPALLATFADIAESRLSELTPAEHSQFSFAQALGANASRLLNLAASEGVSKTLQAAPAQFLAQLSEALAQHSQTPPAPLGPLSALSALRDPQVQKGLGFLVAVLRSLGAGLQARPASSGQGVS